MKVRTAQVEPSMVKRGEVRAVRELKHGVQAQVCMAHIVLPDGTLVGDHVEPAIARAYELGVPMQLSLPRGSE